MCQALFRHYLIGSSKNALRKELLIPHFTDGPKLRGVAHFPQSHTPGTAEPGSELCSAWIQNHCLPTGLCSLPGNHVPSPVPESSSVLSFSVFSPMFPLPPPRHLFSLSFSNPSLIFSLLFHFLPPVLFSSLSGP